jgi:hypothetical protein
MKALLIQTHQLNDSNLDGSNHSAHHPEHNRRDVDGGRMQYPISHAAVVRTSWWNGESHAHWLLVMHEGTVMWHAGYKISETAKGLAQQNIPLINHNANLNLEISCFLVLY